MPIICISIKKENKKTKWYAVVEQRQGLCREMGIGCENVGEIIKEKKKLKETIERKKKFLWGRWTCAASRRSGPLWG